MYTIYPSSVKGFLDAPPSKSMTQRTIIAAMLSKGTSVIYRASICDDTLATMKIATALGAIVKCDKNTITIIGNLIARSNTVLQCGESGFCLRAFAPVASLLSVPVIMAGEGSLLKRPTGMIIEALTQLGVTCITPDENNTLLLAVKGPLKGGNKITIDGSQTSQLLSGLFFALPLADKDSEITVKNLQSKSYVDMTIQVLSRFGIVIREETDGYYKIRGDQHYFSQTCTVEGDWSAAAFLLVVAALRGGATVYNIFGTSKQPDSAILKILMLTGANVELNPMSISVSRSIGTLKPFHFDASGCPDLFPPLVALAAYCKGISVIHGIDRLKTKECDRALALQEEFAKLGIKIELEDNYMKIFGGQGVHGGVEVSSHGDHRIAMSLAVAATGADMPVSIEGAACVKKSYPNFFEDLKRVHIEVKTDNDITDDTTTAMKNE